MAVILLHTEPRTSEPPLAWLPEPDTFTVEAVRANRDIAGFVQTYFDEHPGARSVPPWAALRISEDYGVDACGVLLLIYRILER